MLRAGLIGCGRIGYGFDKDQNRSGTWTHAKAYATHQDIEFVGACDSDHDLLNKCTDDYKIGKFETIADLLDQELNIISVATPQDTHANIIYDILDHKKCPSTIWIEKPFTGNYHVAKNIVSLANKQAVNIHVNYQRRYCAAFNAIKIYGQPQYVNVVYVRGLVNTASHFIDMVVGLYGMPNRVDTITNTDFVLCYNNFNVSFNMVAPQYNMCETTIIYDDKIVRVPPIMSSLFIRQSIVSSQYGEYKDLGPETSISFDYDPMIDQIHAIINGCTNNGLDTLEIIDNICSLEGLCQI